MKVQNSCNHLKNLLFLSFLFISVSLSKKADAQIVPDNTLGNEATTVNSSTDGRNLIEGGAARGANLFHSFLQFNTTSANQNIYFANPQGIRNIITRVTGPDVSNILGTLGVLGNANLFLLNPNGIIFGPNSSLDIKGSFLATTANAIKFENQGFFDASSSSSPPLLTVNPSGFLFKRTNISPIINRSNKLVGTRTPRVNLLGLQVPDGQSLILLGGDIVMDNGGLNALGGEVGIGSVAGTGLVGLSYNGNILRLNFPQDLARGNITFSRQAKVDTSGNGFSGGNINIIGKNIQLKDNSQIISWTTGEGKGGTISLDATDIVEIVGFTNGGKISTLTSSSGAAGDIKIAARKLIVAGEAQITSSTTADGDGGNITVNATESVELKGNRSGIFSDTAARGKGGDISIATLNLVVRDKATISSGSIFRLLNGRLVPGTGNGGNISIIADNSVRIIDGGVLTAKSQGTGKAGNIKIYTKSLEVIKGAIEVLSLKGQAGNLEVIANSLVLNQGRLSAETAVSGANITLSISDILRLENESRITATATGSADGGNITINAGVLLALPPTGPNGSDIVARADRGRGGNIVINAKGIFGIKKRIANPENQTNDIDASSQFGLSGQVDINTATDPNNGLIELPETVVDPDRLVTQNPCNRGWGNEFTVSGRGGLPPSPSQDLSSEATQIKLVEPVQASNGTQNNPVVPEKTSSLNSVPAAMMPAQGWVYNKKGQVVLVAYNPTATEAQRLKPSPAGCPVP